MENNIIIDCGLITDNKQLHTVIRNAIGSENYTGSNLDALYDALTSISAPVKLRFQNFSNAYNTLGTYCDRLLKLLIAASDNNPFLDIKITY